MNGIPARDILEIIMEDLVRMDMVENWPYVRRSWLCLFMRIKHPVVINRRDLNIAWTDMWENARFGMFMQNYLWRLHCRK